MQEDIGKVIKKEPGKDAEIIEIDVNNLEALQEQVGGYIETVTTQVVDQFGKHFVILLNEEGKLLGLEKNIWLKHGNSNYVNWSDPVVGTILILRTDGEDWYPLYGSDCGYWIDWFKHMCVVEVR